MTKHALNKNAGSTTVDLLALSEYVDRFPSKTVLALGDFVADAFQFERNNTRFTRVACPYSTARETRIVPGGGANAANNFVAWVQK